MSVFLNFDLWGGTHNPVAPPLPRMPSWAEVFLFAIAATCVLRLLGAYQKIFLPPGGWLLGESSNSLPSRF